MGILEKYLLPKDNILRKKIEIDNTLYEKVEELAKNKYDASVNKIVNIAIIGLIEKENGSMSSFWTLFLRIFLVFVSLSFS